ncbi:MAG: acyl-CoA synthetase (AMP-forming)/AMP-acid ligase II [Alphaproteobacteria bacterium]|jgi:acyl-CoA synthetase (AMP-forming)/AMP-acid ligase II
MKITDQKFAQPEMDIPFQSIRWVLDTYRNRHPDKIALFDLDQDRGISWDLLAEWANRVARYLAARGIGKGDRIGVLSDEGLEKMIIWMGIWRLGAVICPLNVEINASHISSLLKSIGPKLTLWQDGLDGASLTDGIGGDSLRFDRWDPDMTGDINADEFFTVIAATASLPEVESENEASDLSCIFCTSGTTSRPKCVVYDYEAYWLNGLNTVDFLGLTADDRTLEYRSFGWNSAQVLSLGPWILTGLSMYISRRFSRSRFFDWIKTHEITFSAGVPTVVNILLNEPTGITAEDIPSLRLMTCSTAPLSPEQWKRFEDMYGVTLLQLYGMSEAGWICGNRHYRRRMGTVGPPAKHQEFLIVDNDGNAVAQGEEGEVTIGGPQTCTAIISPEGEWEDYEKVRIRTGDLAIMDEDGFVRVTGRTKDLIIRGGVNIAPIEIDNVLLEHPSLSQAAAIGVPDAIYGEEVVCYVVAKPGETAGEAAILAHCAKSLPEFKAPKHIYVIDDLPKSDRGKVLRDKIRELWDRDHGS